MQGCRLMGLIAQGAVQIEGGADQGQVGEGLGEIAKGLALGAGLLGVEAEVIGVAEHPLEDDAGLVELLRVGLAGAGQRLDQPEGAHVEGAFVAGESIHTGRVAMDEAVAHEAAVARVLHDGVERAEHAGIGGSHEEDKGHHEQGGVEGFAAVGLGEGV